MIRCSNRPRAGAKWIRLKLRIFFLKKGKAKYGFGLVKKRIGVVIAALKVSPEQSEKS